ncbi:FAD-binding oxidoreductase [Persicobacter psychrovividus]|uniref:FAD-dependent oxidoreductase n=1 Tax=Persicobacter psychrovividus TaxID=387638 RepID=A0ABN6LAU9_9BACT|nr:FAD-dependent oxidoreductase [Persicobacter psychrovividus]
MQSYDYIIIGQGIAGTVLSFQLKAEGCRVLVINKTDQNSSSRVAGGLLNPLTGRKIVLSWKAEELFPYLWPFYREMESATKTHFLHPISIYRPYAEIADQNDLSGKSADHRYEPFIENLNAVAEEGIHAPIGGVSMLQSGWADLNPLLDAYRTYLGEDYLEEVFDEQELHHSSEGVKYKGYTAKGIIYAQGKSVAESQYWNWLPFRPVRGEVLMFKSDRELEKIYNKGVFVLPMGNGLYKTGSTYDHADLSNAITEKGKRIITEKLAAFWQLPFELVKHQAGVRPATKDRRPFVGQHPEYSNIYIFGGLGSKGVSLAPYFGAALKSLLLHQKPISEEVSILRYFKS